MTARCMRNRSGVGVESAFKRASTRRCTSTEGWLIERLPQCRFHLLAELFQFVAGFFTRGEFIVIQIGQQADDSPGICRWDRSQLLSQESHGFFWSEDESTGGLIGFSCIVASQFGPQAFQLLGVEFCFRPVAAV